MAQATRIPLQAIADGFAVSLAQAEERHRARVEVERARLEALLR
jgi:hypothetical protein